MTTLNCYFRVQFTQAQLQSFIAAAGITNFNLVGGDWSDSYQITLQEAASRALTSDECTALMAVLPGGATAWTIADT